MPDNETTDGLDLTATAIRLLTCPTCNAGPTEPCRSRTGRKLTDHGRTCHAGRVALVQEIWSDGYLEGERNARVAQARKVLAKPIQGDHESEAARSAMLDLLAIAAERDQIATVAAQQAESITRVLILHSPNRPADDDGDHGQCDGCLAVDPGGYCPWPCPTITALDGPTEDTEPGDPWPASAVAGTATPGCWHPRSCARCDHAGVPCGGHYVGDPGHETCQGNQSGDPVMSDPNTGVGWYEVIHPSKATTHIAYVHEDGSIYFPEGEQVLDRHEFEFAAARGNAHRLVRADAQPGDPS